MGNGRLGDPSDIVLSRRRLHQLVLFAAGIAGACVLGWWLLDRAQLLPGSNQVCWTCSPTILLLAGLSVLTVGQLLTVALLPVIPLSGLLTKERLPSLFWISVVASMINAFAPAKAGVGVKAVIFKRMFGVGYVDFAGAHVAASAVSLIVCVVVVAASYGTELWSLTATAATAMVAYSAWIFAAAVAACFAIALAFWIVGARMQRILESAATALMQKHFILKLPGMLLVAALQVALMGASAMVASFMFGAKPAWDTLLVFGAILALAPLVSFVPGGVGTRESFFVLAGTISGIPAATALAAALVDRLVGTAVITALGLIGVRVLRLASGAGMEVRS